MQVSTGFIHGYSVADWQDLTTFAVEAERIGVDSIWSPEGWGFDGATPLAYLAAKTSRIKLGTGVLQIGTRTPHQHGHDRHVPLLHVRWPVPTGHRDQRPPGH